VPSGINHKGKKDHRSSIFYTAPHYKYLYLIEDILKMPTRLTLLVPFFSVPASHPISLSFRSFTVSLTSFQRAPKQSMALQMR